MGIAHGQGIESTAAVLHHPLHPVAVALPIGSLIFALAADVAFLCTGRAFWTGAAFWLLWAGILTGLAAAALGMIDCLAIGEVRKLKTAKLHAAGNAAAILVATANMVVHWVVPDPPLGWLAVILSAATIGMLGVTGFLGGELSYRYRIGQIASQHGGGAPDPIATELLLTRRRKRA